MKDKFESYNDYPDAVSNNAKRGIELNAKVKNGCATLVGKVRGQQLANGEKISVQTIKRMYSYLSRAEVYYNPDDTEACGTISYLLWGGLAGKRWAESKLKELNLAINEKNEMKQKQEDKKKEYKEIVKNKNKEIEDGIKRIEEIKL
jgi:hypothetical protein